MKYATPDELRHHKKVTKGLVLSMIKDVEDAVDAYADKEYDQGEIDKVSGLGEGAIQEAYGWFEDLDEAYGIIRNTREKRCGNCGEGIKVTLQSSACHTKLNLFILQISINALKFDRPSSTEVDFF